MIAARSIWKLRLILPCVLAVTLFFVGRAAPLHASEPIPVKVGAYDYGTVYFYEDGKPKGIVPALINLLNDLQDDYQFELVETSSRRRYHAVTNGDVDLLLLESSTWEWGKYDVQFSDPIVTDSDIYLTRSDHPDRKTLLEDVTKYPILCVLGFHYAFAGNNSDPEYLKQNFHVLLRYSEEEVLRGLLAGEAPIAIVSSGFLKRQFVDDPDLRDLVMIGEEPDAEYDLVSVLSNKSVISSSQLNGLIEQVLATGEVERLWGQLHIDVDQ